MSDVQMIDALTEIHLLESAVKLNLIKGLKNDSLNIRDYYEALFDMKPYSYKEFQESFTYFTRSPVKWRFFGLCSVTGSNDGVGELTISGEFNLVMFL